HRAPKPATTRELRDAHDGNDARDRDDGDEGRAHGRILLDSRAMRVAWLGEPASLDAASVGGKTANLGRLATSFRVPLGFCLDATVHQRLGGALEGESWARYELHQLVVDAYTELAKRLGIDAPL